ncbi:MAG: carboxypeptidase-like regulatory domain-containing protein [Schlesneria sp.]
MMMKTSSTGNSPHQNSNRIRLRQGWLSDQPVDSQIAFRRWIRIFTIATMTFVTVALLIWQLFAPFQHSNAHAILISGEPLCSDDEDLKSSETPGRYEDVRQSRLPVDFVSEDFSAIKSLNGLFSKRTTLGVTQNTGDVHVLQNIQRLQSRLENMDLGRSDVLMLFLTAQSTVENNEPLFELNIPPEFADLRHNGIDEILRRIKNTRSQVKLLIVDTGRYELQPSRGIILNDLPRFLKKAVEDCGDPQLWVLTSNEAFESSDLTRSLERSVFSLFVEKGLKGAADLNRDRQIDLGELFQFVKVMVSEFVRQTSNGTARQTPELLWGGGPQIPLERPILVPVAKPAKDLYASEDFLQYLQDSNQTPIGSVFASVPNEILNTTQQIKVVNEPYLVTSNEIIASRTSVSGEVTGAGPVTTNSSNLTAKGSETPAKSVNQSSSSDASKENAPPKPVDKEGSNYPSPAPSKTVANEAKDRIDTVRLATLITEVWGMRDDLERDPWSPTNPAISAPEEWRMIQETLLLEERRFRAGRACDQQQVAMVMNTLLDGLKALLRKETFPFQSTHERKSSELIRRVQQRMAHRPSKLLTPHSFGFAELLTRHGGRSIEPSLRDLIGQFDRWFKEGSEGEFQDWVKKLDSNNSDFVEIQFAQRLATEPLIGWETKQLALRVCRIAEKTAALDLNSTDWIDSEFELGSDFKAAEELRKAGERTLLDQIGKDRERESKQYFQQALLKYQSVTSVLQDVSQAHRLCDQLTRRVPHYVRWHYEMSRRTTYASRISDLFQLTEDLKSLVAILEQPRPGGLVKMNSLCTKLIRLQDKIEVGLEPGSFKEPKQRPAEPGDQFPIEALLTTPLPTQSARLTLLTSLVEIARRNLSHSKQSQDLSNNKKSSSLNLLNPDWPVCNLMLELVVPRLGAIHFNGLQDKLSELEAAAREIKKPRVDDAMTKSESSERFWEKYETFSGQLRQYYEIWLSEITSATTASLDSLDPTARNTRVTALRAARRGLQLTPIDPISAEAAQTPTMLLEQAELYNALSFQIRRYQYLQSGTPRQEAVEYTRLIQFCRDQIKKLSGQPSPPEMIVPRLRWSGSESVAFDTAEAAFESSSELKLEWFGESKTPAWVSVHFDPDLLDVSVAADVQIPRQTTTSFIAPDARMTKQKTCDLHLDRPKFLRLNIRRRDHADRPTRVIFYASTRNETARMDISIKFPPQPSTELVINGIPGTWSVGDGKNVELHPFPNRNTNYEFSLANIGEPIQRELSLKWLAPKNPVDIEMPRTELSADEAVKLLDKIGPTDALTEVVEVKLPANTTPVKIPFPKAVAPSPVGKTPATSSDLVPQGVILMMTDRSSGQSLFRSIAIEPQRPRRFLSARVQYNADRERIEVTIVPIDRGLIPPQGVKIRANLIEAIPEDAARELEADLAAPSFEARMFVEVPTGPEKIVTLQLSVDDYPRAFTFRVPCHGNTGNLPAITNEMGVTISSPAEKKCYQTPLNVVAVDLQVDVPEGAFRVSGDVLQVGIDRNNDRDFRDEPVLSLNHDRQVETTLFQFGPDGLLELLTRVGDFHVRVPATGVLNANAQLLARLVVSDRTAWSRPVPVTFDATSPRVNRIRFSPPGAVVIGDKLKMTATATDNDLSGVAKVEAVFDLDRTGQFPVGAKPIAAELNPEGNWEAPIPTADIKSGQHTLLVRAIDRVGNVGEVTKVKIKAFTAEEMKEQNSTPISVSGTVKYGGQPMSGIRVSAESAGGPKLDSVETDEKGNFRLNGLTPGKWMVQAKGVVRNKTRTANAELEIKPAENPQPIQFTLK